jgi:hypothetical protein
MLSDEKLKYDIYPLDESLDKIQKLRPVEYRWKRNSAKDIGFIAQNIETVFPNLVSKTKRGLLAVKYPNFVAVAISGIQEQQKQIHGLESTVESLREENKALRKEMTNIKQVLCNKSSLDFCK